MAKKIINNQNNEKLALYYFQVTDLWKNLCEEHSELFNVTCDEYSLLLSSELNELENKLIEKEKIIKNINRLEFTRRELIDDLNKEFPEFKVESVSTLLEFMSRYEIENKEKHLFRFNALLIDMIEKIQAQNKRNQLFINKALISLKQIRMEALGQKNYSVYTAKGSSINTST